MSTRTWIILACMSVAASLPACASTLTSSSQDLMTERLETTQRQQMKDPLARNGLVFRNSMKESKDELPELVMPKGDASSSADLSLDDRGITSLPEPSSGVLVSMGFALLCFSRKKALA